MPLTPASFRATRRLLATSATAAALAACAGDSPTGLEPSTGSTQTFSIIPAPTSGSLPGLEGKQLSVAPGDTARLSGRITDSRSGSTSVPALTWRSSDVAVAEVDAAGLLHARATGSASVVATADRFADTLRVVVSSCGSARALDLRVGQVQAFDPGQGMDLCVVGGTAAQEYALIPYYATETHDSEVTARLSVTASGTGATLAADVAPPTDGPSLARLGPSASRAALGGPQLTDAPLHRRLRRLTDRELGSGQLARARETRRSGRADAFARRVARRSLSSAPSRSAAPAAPSAAPSANVGMELPTASGVLQAVPRTGELLRINTRTEAPAGTRASCDTITSAYRIGRVAAVSNRAIIVADTSNPSGGFSDAEYRAFAVAFDTLAYPVGVTNFGDPSDIDRNQRVTIFFTSAVNALTPRSADYVVGGFFWERDLFPNNVPESRGGCAGSNASEMFYMLVPDPSGAINGNVRRKDYVGEVTIGTVAHEFQHLINAARRIYVNDADEYEDIWLNEGLSHIAEELVFYRASGLAPRGRVTASGLRATGATFDAFNQYGNDNLRRLITYLRSTESRSPFADDDDLETRGATWQFLRYTADRLAGSGGRDVDFWKKLVDSKIAGRKNLQAALGSASPLDDWFRDWTVANYLDTQAPALGGLEARYTFPSWSYRGVVGSYADQLGRPYLTSRALVNDVPATVRLTGGSAAYLRFAVGASRQAALRTRLTTPPSVGAVRLAVVRTR